MMIQNSKNLLGQLSELEQKIQKMEEIMKEFEINIDRERFLIELLLEKIKIEL